MQGSARSPYILKNIGGVYSCSCPAWRNTVRVDRTPHLQTPTAAARRTGRGRSHRHIESDADSICKSPVSLRAGFVTGRDWDGEQDVTNWHLSEKLDGVRALWTGTQFLSRSGHTYHAPAWFTAGLPQLPLDGELWLARKSFQRTVSIVRRGDGNQLWRELKF